MRVVKAAAVQVSPVLYSREGTVEKVVRKIHELGRQGVQFATIPETVVPYYPYFSFVQPPLQNIAGPEQPKLLALAKGLAVNIEREKQFMSGVKDWEGFTVTAAGVGDNMTFYESTSDFVTTGGVPVHVEQVSVAKWKNGKIAHERFYYDTGKH